MKMRQLIRKYNQSICNFHSIKENIRKKMLVHFSVYLEFSWNGFKNKETNKELSCLKTFSPFLRFSDLKTCPFTCLLWSAKTESVQSQNWHWQAHNGCFQESLSILSYSYSTHRIIIDRMENSIKGSRIWHCAFAASIFKVQRLRQY